MNRTEIVIEVQNIIVCTLYTCLKEEVTTQISIKHRLFISNRRHSATNMSKFFANYIYLTIVLVMIQSVVTEFIYDDDDTSSVYGGEDTIPNNPNDMLGQNFDIMTDVQANELGNNLFSAFFGQNSFMDIQNVVQTATPKPDFTTSFDIFKLMNKSYARKQFYCVINKEPCDSVGTRLKGT